MGNKNNIKNQINISGSNNSIGGNINQTITNKTASKPSEFDRQGALDSVMTYIAQGKPANAAYEILEHSDDIDITNSATLILGRINILEKKQINNLLSLEEVNLETAKISDALLKLVQALKK